MITERTSLISNGDRPSEGSSSKRMTRTSHQSAGDRQHLLLAAAEFAALGAPLLARTSK